MPEIQRHNRGPVPFEAARTISDFDPSCERCWQDAHEKATYGVSHGPTHNGSASCRQMRVTGHGAIAAGGTIAHCDCAGCF